MPSPSFPSPNLRRQELCEEIERLEIMLCVVREHHIKEDYFNDAALSVQEKIRARILKKREELKKLKEQMTG